FPAQYEDLLLHHMPVLAGAACRRDLLHIEPDPARRTLDVGMDIPFDPPPRAPLPRVILVAHAVRDFFSELPPVAAQLEIPIVGVSLFFLRRPNLGARAKDSLRVRRRSKIDVEILGDAQNPSLDAIADNLPFAVMQRLGSFGKGRGFAEFDLFPVQQS